MGMKNIKIVGILGVGYKVVTVLGRSPEEKQLRLSAKGEISHIKDEMKLQNIDNLDGRDEIKNIKLQLRENIFDLKEEKKNQKLQLKKDVKDTSNLITDDDSVST